MKGGGNYEEQMQKMSNFMAGTDRTIPVPWGDQVREKKIILNEKRTLQLAKRRGFKRRGKRVG